jgi:hypothetical protein
MTINSPSLINLIRPHHIEFGFGAVPITGRCVLAKRLHSRLVVADGSNCELERG